MHKVPLGRSGLQVTPVCLGTMTFGEQVDQATAFSILDHALERGIDFIDTAEMYSVPTRRETFGATERIIGNWFAARPGVRDKVTLATKVAGPGRGMDWIRAGVGMTPADIVASCEKSLRQLQTDRLDLYQIHWPERHVPAFGNMYFDPDNQQSKTPILAQLEALDQLVRQGKILHIGLSNETPYGVHEFVSLAERHGLARIASVQNPYNLLIRAVDNGLDETMHHLGVGLLAYSPLAAGLLTGKYDASGTTGPAAPAQARITKFETVRKQRWGRPLSLEVARKYNALAREHGLTPSQLALAFCYTRWSVTSTIIGVTSVAQLDEDLDAWGTKLSPELLAAVDALRHQHRDPGL